MRTLAPMCVRLCATGKRCNTILSAASTRCFATSTTHSATLGAPHHACSTARFSSGRLHLHLHVTLAVACRRYPEAALGAHSGVKVTRAGYCGGTAPRPTYEKVCADPAFGDWSECVQVDFDERELPFEELCRLFFASHEPDLRETKGQYMSAIYAHTDEQLEVATRVLHSGSFRQSIATTVARATDFWEAELYHQKWLLQKSPWLEMLSDPRDLVEGEPATRLNALVGGHLSREYLRWYMSSWVRDGRASQETHDRILAALDRDASSTG